MMSTCMVPADATQWPAKLRSFSASELCQSLISCPYHWRTARLFKSDGGCPQKLALEVPNPVASALMILVLDAMSRQMLIQRQSLQGRSRG